MDQAESKEVTKSVGSSAWVALKAVGLAVMVASLAVADFIIATSLLFQGARPKPGVRASWPKGLRGGLSGEQKGLCMYCCARLRLNACHIDHVTPVNQGGTNDRWNLQLLCPGCNVRKSDRSDAEFRHRYRKLLPQQPRTMPARRIRQAEFRSVTRTSRDADSYLRFKAGKYITASQKVTYGALATGVVVFLVIYLPVSNMLQPADGNPLVMTSLIVGATVGLGVRVRAWWTGKEQED